MMEIFMSENINNVNGKSVFLEHSMILNNIVSNGKNYVQGSIVGYYGDSFYRVILKNNKYGIIPCSELDDCKEVKDYANKSNSKYELKYRKEWSSLDYRIIQYMSERYYFEIINENYNNSEIYLLSMENVKMDYLDYIIKEDCIIQGEILEFHDNLAIIKIPYGFIFSVERLYIFGSQAHHSFRYINYLDSKLLLNLRYNKERKSLYPYIIKGNKHLLYEKAKYIFPIMDIWDKVPCSQLWLDKKIQIIDKKKNFPVKKINKLIITSKVKMKGEKSYKCNMEKIISARKEGFYRNNILSMGVLIDLKGMSIENAIEYLKENEFFYNIKHSYNTNFQKGQVFEMIPELGQPTIIPKNIIVQLNVSYGEPMKYKVPDMKGWHINKAKKYSIEQHINIRYKIVNETVEEIGDNCVIATNPESEAEISCDYPLEVTVYKVQKYESPYALRENEFPRINREGKVVGNKYNIEQFCMVEWQKQMLEIILIHKVIDSKHICQFINSKVQSEIAADDIKSSLKYLEGISMISSVNARNYVATEAQVKYYYPLKDLYDIYEYDCDYNGRFSPYNKVMIFFKLRAAENQAFLKLYEILKSDYEIEYFVDMLQFFLLEKVEHIIKMHICVLAEQIVNRMKRAFIIEAVRYWTKTSEAEYWDKLMRYKYFFNQKYKAEISVILVFEDLEHKEKFMKSKPDDFCDINFQLLYTIDKLTNSDEMRFEYVFLKCS